MGIRIPAYRRLRLPDHKSKTAGERTNTREATIFVRLNSTSQMKYVQTRMKVCAMIAENPSVLLSGTAHRKEAGFPCFIRKELKGFGLEESGLEESGLKESGLKGFEL